MENKDLVQAGATGLSLMNDFMMDSNALTGFENVSASDLSLPKIKLLQMTSQEVSDEKGRPGEFYNTQTGTSSKEIVCYLMQVNKPMAYFEMPYTKGSTAICRSIDGKVGKCRDGATRSCDNCVESDWNKALAEGKTKPNCTSSYAWLGATVEDNVPFRLTCSGDSVKTTRTFINSLIYKRIAMFCHTVKVSSEKVSNSKGTYYKIKYDLVESYSGKDIQAMPQDKQMELASIWGERQEMAKSLAEFFNKDIEIDSHDAVVVEDAQPATEAGALF